MAPMGIIALVSRVYHQNSFFSLFAWVLSNCASYMCLFQISHNWPSKCFIVPIIIFSIIYNIPKFFELKVGPQSDTIADSLTSNLSALSENISDSFWQKNISLNSSSPDKYSEANVFILQTWIPNHLQGIQLQ